jgi:hypothetical protein
VFSILTRKAAGALSHPAFPAPSVFERRTFLQSLGRRASRDGGGVSGNERSMQTHSSCPDLIRASTTFLVFRLPKTWMAGSSSAKTRFALLPGHDDRKMMLEQK